MLVIYLDTSAFVKLVWAEPESNALGRYLAQRAATPLASSSLLTVEIRRAVQREYPSALPGPGLLLTRIGMTASLVESASRLPDRSLRSRDTDPSRHRAGSARRPPRRRYVRQAAGSRC